ncbi:MurR/RpiR family transcriptional regulator [Nonomuraea sp. NPDC050680]|uniref:MurR/RpiR family transcriptional regulator n=1 Tax=Nonomuraea sp. NPDC050680 TaxID=3154630 RepID=UPI0033F37DA9
MTERVTDSFQDWLRERVPERGLRPKAAALLEVLLSQPRRASFASAAELAQLAGVNVATVTRTAQALGFAGWPALQQELRARYLSSLSAPQVAAEHSGAGSPSSRSLRRDLDSLALLNRRLDEGVLRTIAEAVAAAGRTVIVADGSYAAVGMALAHNARLAGYPVAAVTSGDAELANSVAAIGPGDVLIAISFWRLYESTVLAANEARARGVRVFALTDAASPALANAAEEVVMVPAEGVAFFPSLTAGMAVAQALVTQLATVDPARTSASIETAEGMWSKFGLLHRRPAPPAPADQHSDHHSDRPG